jgi:hypothetical protein
MSALVSNSTLTRLITLEGFSTFMHCESFKSYINQIMWNHILETMFIVITTTSELTFNYDDLSGISHHHYHQ